jgi:hypothetical protein
MVDATGVNHIKRSLNHATVLHKGGNTHVVGSKYTLQATVRILRCSKLESEKYVLYIFYFDAQITGTN